MKLLIQNEIEWGYRYNVLVERYADIIKGQFFGHTHVDNFVTQPSVFNPKKYVSSTFIHPSLTTHSDLNPSFRIYYANPENYNLLDYVQYRFFVDEVNKSNKPEWIESYRFTKLFSVPDLSPNSLLRAADLIHNNSSIFEKFVKLHYQDGPYYKDALKTNSIFYNM